MVTQRRTNKRRVSESNSGSEALATSIAEISEPADESAASPFPRFNESTSRGQRAAASGWTAAKPAASSRSRRTPGNDADDVGSRQRNEDGENAPAVEAHPVAPTALLSETAHEVARDLSMLAGRLADSRDEIARSTLRIEIAERRAQRAEDRLVDSEQRLVAARALVYDAQQTAQRTAEHCAFVEGRCDALELALEKALNAPFWKLRGWRRARRANSLDL